MKADDRADLIAVHAASFGAAVALAERQGASGRYEQAAAFVAAASAFASEHHPGQFSSPALEAVLVSGSRHLHGTDGRSVLCGRQPPNRVLHVFTEAYEVGGHSRLGARWMSLDSQRSHSVVTTRQRAKIPDDLVKAAYGSGGRVIHLDRHRLGLMGAAAELALLASEFDLVALHIHPYDVVPALAFAAAPQRPRVVLVNHGDHLFWIGCSGVDMILSLRDVGRQLAVSRRGFPESRVVDFSIPLPLPQRELSQPDAKARLGIERNRVVLLTVATEYKFVSSRRPDFLDVVEPVLAENDDVVLLAVGPHQAGRWQDLAARVSGRLRALGPLSDTALHRQAADVYLDSWPFASITSLLESAAMGTASLAYTSGRSEGSVTFSDPPSVEGALLRADDAESFTRHLSHLVGDPEYRLQLGERLRAQVVEAHAADGWRRGVDRMYAAVAAVDDCASLTGDIGTRGPIDDEVASVSHAAHGPLAMVKTLVSLERRSRRPERADSMNPGTKRGTRYNLGPQWWLGSTRAALLGALIVWRCLRRGDAANWAHPSVPSLEPPE